MKNDKRKTLVIIYISRLATNNSPAVIIMCISAEALKMAAPGPPAAAPPGLAEVLQDLGAQGPPPQGFLGFPAPVGGAPAAPQGPSTKHPYAFRRHPPSPPTLLFLATQRLLARLSKMFLTHSILILSCPCFVQ